MNLNKFCKKLILSYLIVVICIFGANIFSFENSNLNLQENTFPHTSTSKIDIKTPENKTYSAPMTGYYPGTFGFEDVPDDTIPSYCDYHAIGTSPDFVTSYTRVINSKVDGVGNAHNKVWLLKDGSGSSVCISYLNFTDYGSEIARDCTLEFYHCLNLAGTHYLSRIVLAGNHGTLLQIIFDTNALQIDYLNGTGQYYTGVNLARDRWYRYSIDISCDGGYAGLSSNQFRFRIYDENGILVYTSYDMGFQDPHPTGGPNRISMVSSETQTQVYEYMDAFSITGLQDGYEIGDNLNEGILLSFENSTDLDWLGYSLDNQPTISILGNTTILLPQDGSHVIQVFGSDTFGTMYESNIRYFSVHHMNIITPEEKTYSAPMSGYYPGIFGFEDVLDDTTPSYCEYSAIGTIPDYVTSYTTVINNKVDGAGNAHNKVWLLKDGSGSSVCIADLNFTDYGSDIARDCTLEFYHCLNLAGTHYLSRIVVSGNYGALFQIIFDTNALQIDYLNGTGQYYTGVNLARDRWYRYSIDLSCSGGYAGLGSNQFRFRVYDENGVLVYTSYDMGFQTSHPTGGPNQIRMVSSETQTQVYEYMDAFSITGLQDGYEIGDNLNEGLLLSFENLTSLDWMGYSLDNQPTISILGNTTIPLPQDGSHVIQVFGSDTFGTKYESNIRYFSVHHINIITPEEKTYTAPMSGYYPGTFGFEDVPDDTTPSYCEYSAIGTSPDYVTSYTTVINNKVDGAGNAHNKVWLLKDGSGSSVCIADLNFTDYGSDIARDCTLEFHHCLNLAGTHYLSRIVVSGNYGALFQIIFDTNALQIDYLNGTGQYYTGVNLARDRWYRYSIDLSCSGGYAGLGSNQFRFRVYDENGVLVYTSYDMGFQTSHPTGGPNQIRMVSSETQTQVYEYMDAFSITGLQDGYEIGDNLNEGLLLSFENSTALNWMGYSLDSQPTISILGNTTIPLPQDGSHVIQVFGSDTFGTNYESNLCHFSVNHINIVTPENKLYTNPMSGYFPGTFGFEDVPDDTTPSYCEYSAIGTIPDYVTSYTTVINNKVDGVGNAHNKVWLLKDGSSSSVCIADLNFTDYGSDIARDCTLEFYHCINLVGTHYLSRIVVAGNHGTLFQIIFDTNALQIDYLNGTGQYYTGVNLARDRWYRYSIDLSCSGGYAGLGSNQFRFRVYDENGVLVYTSYDMGFQTSHPTGGPNQIRMVSSETQTQVYEYMDAFSITGLQDGYEVGDNLNEGLLLSFENSTNLNWMGYSLDSQPIISILGNTTIPLPQDGSHAIQVFGNDTFGENYQSKFAYFSIDVNPPIISIISPNPNAFSGFNAPTFNIDIIEPNLDSTWYTIDGGITNITFAGLTGIVYQTEWDKLSDGGLSLTFYAKDTTGKIGHTDVTIFKDTIIPQITIDAPTFEEKFGAVAPNFNISIVELNLDSTWYTIDGGITNITFTGLTGTVDQTEWDKLSDGDLTLTFYAKDSAGNIGSLGVLINKDAGIPQITINTPLTDEFFGSNAPNFDISIIESDLNSTWYTIDGGITNIIFIGLTGSINQTEWEKISSSDSVTIRFYANDTTGNIGHADVIINKDIAAPSSQLIFTPYSGTNEVITRTTFTLTANDGSGSGVSVIRYKIDDSSWIDYTGGFDLSGYAIGSYNISYYAIDNVGNIENFNSILVELVDEPPEIPGYDLIFLLAAIGISLVITIRKRKNKF